MSAGRAGLRAELVSLARRAGKILMERFGSATLKSHLKADASPVTEADLASHEFLLAELSQRFGLPVVSEEGDLVPPKGTEFFLVDPLDGTLDFVNRIPEFSVCIALVRDGRPVAGVIHGPAVSETYSATEGEGAWANLGSGEERLPLRPTVPSVLLRSRYHDTPRVARFGERNGFLQSLVVGSALKYGQLARGEAAAYLRFTDVAEWDIAAGHILLKEAGGSLTELETLAEPHYGKPGFRGPGFIACAPEISPRNLIYDI
jgi:3'(2'), 5'-bisphosphate nucleotidase